MTGGFRQFESNAALRSGGALVSFRGMAFVRLSLLALATCLVWTGCPPGDRKVDERKDKWFVLGENRQNSMDYPAAVEAFQKALEANPHNASAHKKLGFLYDREDEVRDHWAAIYHYRRLLALNPDDKHADIIRDAIENCQRELCGDVGPIAVDQVTAKILEERDALSQELVKERDENRRLRAALAKAGSAQSGVSLPEISSVGGGEASRTTGNQNPPPPRPRETASPPQPADPPPAARRSTHVVQKSETMYSIARRYNVSPARLQAANPRVNPRTMKEGTILRIPDDR